MSKPAEPIKEEFCQRFVAHMLAQAGETFDDGRSVKEYAEENALAYWDDPHYRDEGPEACAESDMSYWGED